MIHGIAENGLLFLRVRINTISHPLGSVIGARDLGFARLQTLLLGLFLTTVFLSASRGSRFDCDLSLGFESIDACSNISYQSVHLHEQPTGTDDALVPLSWHHLPAV